MSSRAHKRAGYGALSGAANPRVTRGGLLPKNPGEGDIHIDRVRGEISEYYGGAWITYQMLYVSDSEPSNKNVLWLDIS